MASRRDLETGRQLLDIDGARAAAEKAKLQLLERQRLECKTELARSETKIDEAFEAWSASIGSKALGPSYLMAAADHLLIAERQLVQARQHLIAAERDAEDQVGRLRLAEAQRSHSEKRFTKERRLFLEGQAERAQDDVQAILLSRRALT